MPHQLTLQGQSAPIPCSPLVIPMSLLPLSNLFWTEYQCALVSTPTPISGAFRRRGREPVSEQGICYPEWVLTALHRSSTLRLGYGRCSPDMARDGTRPMIPESPRPSFLSNLSSGLGLWGKIGAGLAAIVLIAGFALTLQVVNAAHSTTTSKQQVQVGSGPATPTEGQTVVATMTGAATATSGTGAATPTSATVTSATATSGTGAGPTNTRRNDVRITQNQDEQVSCSGTPAPSSRYPVQLSNAGNEAVGWQVVFPMVSGNDNPYWGYATPESGSVGPGQSASFTVTVLYAVPCGGSKYTATIKLTYPAGSWQPDLTLTYEGTGPVPVSNVVLVSGQLNNPTACPGTAAPAPFTFAIKNTGNGNAYPYLYITDKVYTGTKDWAAVTNVVDDPPNPQVTDWLYPGETWTVTVTPQPGETCDGTTPYRVFIGVNNSGGPATTITLTYTFK